MPDSKYCYANSDVLINKLGITDGSELFQAEKQLTFYSINRTSKYADRRRFLILNI